MRIRGLGVIDDAVLELSAGLTVVTGETGAGTTLVVTGLGLLFGGRADPGAVRPGQDSASVEGRLRVDPGGAVVARALDAGAQLDDDVLLLARTVSASGRSRAHLGGRGVPAATLAELAESCVAVHGQSDQSRLLQPAAQRDALDRYAGDAVLEPLTGYRTAYDGLRAARIELEQLTRAARDRAQEAERLTFGLEDIERVDPQPGETTALRVEEDRLGSADVLRGAASRARSALVGADDGEWQGGAAQLVAEAGMALGQVGVSDPDLAALIVRVKEIGYLTAEVGSDLAGYASSIDTDPARLSIVQDRRSELARIARKYGGGGESFAAESFAGADAADDPGDEMTAVLAWAQHAAALLAGIEGDDDRVIGLRERTRDVTRELARLAGEVSTARAAAAVRFAHEVSVELTSLAMGNAAVEVAVHQIDATDGLVLGDRTVTYGRHGVDDVEMLLRPHAGAAARALQKGASGGELSRVMLAVEVVLAGTDPVPTLVFDEVDAGVGGKAAVEVGRRLAALSRHTQVIVVTHLPQVAAFADQHLVVRKSDDGAVTRSGVEALDDAGRLRELSRMLAGQEESATAEAHARELLEVAAGARAGEDG